ncbi:MAG: hypothetical protein WBF48_12740 [Halarcobacter sp.]
MNKIINLSIFGDNILECERMTELIQKSFPKLTNIEYDKSIIYAPLKRIFDDSLSIEMQLYPDYKSSDRWGKKSILDILISKGSKLTEAPDVILTRTIDDKEEILLAIEFSSAIPAGNQAWQRSGRALSFSEVFIPYLYITDIGLEELDAEREVKAVRTSNPLVPLSYIKHSHRNPSFTYMVLNPSYLLKSSPEIQKFIVDDEVHKLINGLVLDKDVSEFEEKLENKIAHYLNNYETTPDTINFNNWVDIEDADIEDFISKFELPKYNKIVAKKTPIKPEMLNLIKEIIPEYALSIYNNIPICIIPANKRIEFVDKIIMNTYNDLENDIVNKLKNTNDMLVVCLINGFKPRGDDARPDRGLVPLARMLFGFDVDLVSFVFGQATREMQNNYDTNTFTLASKNGLWKSILFYSDVTLADSTHWILPSSKIGKLKLTQECTEHTPTELITFEKPEKKPIKFKENDIDTAIHLTIGTHNSVFESLCNPPGGDWSGISLIDSNNIEHRWMSLPRVSNEAKRPDHIFQIFDDTKNYLLIIESKEKVNGLIKDKDELGEALISYLDALISYKSSAIKDCDNWEKNEELMYDLTFDGKFSAAAYAYKTEQEFLKGLELNVDLIMGFNLLDFSLKYKVVNENGDLLLDILSRNNII